MAREIGGYLFGQTGVLRQTHLRELHADVGVELACRNGIQKLVIHIRGAVGFVGVGHAFAQRIECGVHALRVELRADAERVFDFETGDKPRTELAAEAGVFSEFAERSIVRERNKGGA